MRKLALDAAPLMVLAGAAITLARDSAPKPARRRWHEPDRGRGARSPREIPAQGWKDILLRTKTEFTEDQIPLIAAGVTFYVLLALFPGLGAFVALYGLFADVAEAQRHLQILAFIVPADMLTFIGDQMIRLAQGNKGGLSLAFAFGLLVSIWSANGAMKAIMTGLNIAYEETERRGWIRKTLTSLAFTLGFLAFVILSSALLAAGPAVAAFAGAHAALVFKVAAWPVLAAAVTGGLAVLYRYGPSRERPRWRWISWGSVVAVLLWAAASAAISIYIGEFAHYDRTYGPLGAVIGLMMWSWVSTMVILLGAELNSEIEHQTAVDSTTGAPRPLGMRGAKMADTVGAAQAGAGRKARALPPAVVKRAG
jgi:membrane protein